MYAEILYSAGKDCESGISSVSGFICKGSSGARINKMDSAPEHECMKPNVVFDMGARSDTINEKA